MRKLCCVLIIVFAGALAWGAPWKFAVLCDSRGEESGVRGSEMGVRTTALHAMAISMAKEGIDLVLFPGDQVNGGASCGKLADQLKTWKTAMAPIYDAHIPVYIFRGNHETVQNTPRGSAVEVWEKLFPEMPMNGPHDQKGLTYLVKHQNATFIGFDQYVGRSKTYDVHRYDSTVNYGVVHPWVIEQINATKTPWLFVFGHEMAFIGHHTDCLANAPAERDALWDALGAHNGVYLCGHDHMYVRRTAPDSKNYPVLEMVVGCAGAPFYPDDHEALNAQYDRHVVPTDLFVNAGIAGKNTDGLRPYFGYVLFTIDGNKCTGEWKALVNYDYKNWEAPAQPQCVTKDTFTLTAK